MRVDVTGLIRRAGTALLGAFAGLGASTVVFAGVAAAGQQGLCAPPEPEDTYYTTCSEGRRALVARFLHDFAWRQYGSGTNSFRIPSLTFLDTFDFGNLLSLGGSEREGFAKSGASLEFRPTDAVSGEFTGRNETSRTFTSTEPITGTALRTEVGDVIEGTYWRSPSTLELRFHEGRGIRFTVTPTDKPPLTQEILCVSITPSTLRAETSDPARRFLLANYEVCP